MGTTFPLDYSRNSVEAWSIKDGHLHSTLTAFIRLGQQQDRWNIGISNSHSPRLKRKEQNFASKSVLECKLLKLTFQNYTGYLYPYKPNALLMTFLWRWPPDTLCLWALSFSAVVETPIFGLLWSRPAELPLVANVVRYSALWIWLPLWILLAAALHPALCPLILPWSCLARLLVLFLPGPGLCCRSFLPSVVI